MQTLTLTCTLIHRHARLRVAEAGHILSFVSEQPPPGKAATWGLSSLVSLPFSHLSLSPQMEPPLGALKGVESKTY